MFFIILILKSFIIAFVHLNLAIIVKKIFYNIHLLNIKKYNIVLLKHNINTKIQKYCILIILLH